jgi:iron-sulfur cluster repair protein YtfE (RIC family)
MRQIKELFSQFKGQIIAHMKREEKDFFPILREIENCHDSKKFTKCDLKRFNKIITRLEREHDEFDTYVFDLIDVFKEANLHRENREVYEKYDKIFSSLEDSVMKHTEIENTKLHILARKKYDILSNLK